MVLFVASAIVTIAPEWVRARGLPVEVWYEAIPWVVSLVTLGRLLEERAKRRAGEAVRALASRAPSTARVIREGREVDVQGRWEGTSFRAYSVAEPADVTPPQNPEIRLP